ncbi:thiE [Wigglesworthia glossinidia endosymbiont of Glossina brevipalpis]|uniref:Thiamine-phosphate synthase n=1 Tax=Wigglesworthia glossinidia brevipalpis TaxID=36870 RepID=Q8D248_WIGBR|nr:thiE [Wigglesworthia glossinidia endosymbiont of Glossina brevipalpis]
MCNKIKFPIIPKNIGLYPIIDSLSWLVRILSVGIKTVQIRIKEKDKINLDREIESAIILGKKYKANLFINDYWELAVKHKAYGVHLGQKDMNNADIKYIYKSGLRLGLSTRNDQEVERALKWNPSYISFGHVFHTNTKIMKSSPQGINKLKELCNKINNCPKVAIGGIGLCQIDEVLKCKINGISMISAITKSKDWKKTIYKIQKKIKIKLYEKY